MKSPFTPSFFRFLLVFSLIILAAFLILTYAEMHKQARLDVSLGASYHPS